MGTISGMPALTISANGEQLELLPDATACASSPRALTRPGGVDGRAGSVPTRQAAPGEKLRRRDRITVDLRGLRSRLEARASQRGITAAALVRRAVVFLLDDGSPERGDIACAAKATSGQVAKVTLRMSPTHAATLARQARAADVAQGQYVCALLDGAPAPPLPADHSASVAALRASTDRVAAMSTDLNAFMRLLGRVPAEQLEGYRGGLMSLAGDMRAHLAKASALLAEITPSRRPKR